MLRHPGFAAASGAPMEVLLLLLDELDDALAILRHRAAAVLAR